MNEDDEKAARLEARKRSLASVLEEAKQAAPQLVPSKITWDPYTGWVVELSWCH